MNGKHNARLSALSHSVIYLAEFESYSLNECKLNEIVINGFFPKVAGILTNRFQMVNFVALEIGVEKFVEMVFDCDEFMQAY